MFVPTTFAFNTLACALNFKSEIILLLVQQFIAHNYILLKDCPTNGHRSLIRQSLRNVAGGSDGQSVTVFANYDGAA